MELHNVSKNYLSCRFNAPLTAANGYHANWVIPPSEYKYFKSISFFNEFHESENEGIYSLETIISGGLTSYESL